MDERTRKTVTWIVLGCLVAIIVAFAAARKMELDRLADAIGSGRPADQLAAVERLVQKQKMVEGLEDRPRWVQDRAALGIARLGTYDALWEAAGAAGQLDGPPGGRLGTAIKQEGQVAADLLVEAIQDKDATRRGTCAGPLGQIGVPAIDPLVHLMDAWDQYVRDIVRDQLSAMATTMAGNQKAAQDLLDLRKKWLAQYEAQYAKTKSPADLALVTKQQEKVTEAGEKLEEVPPPNIVPDLLMSITEAPQPPEDQKEEVAKYLRRVATAKATVVANKGPVVDAVIKQLLTATVPDVRATGCDLLGQMGNQTYTLNGDVLAPPLAEAQAQVMVKPLLERLQKDSDWTVRRRACIALGRLQLVAMNQGATPPLIAALGDRQPDVKAAAAEALGMVAAARPFDVKALKWTDTGPNTTAKAAAQPLALTLRQNRVGAANELAMALENCGPPAIPDLLPALDHPEEEVRLLATQTIARIGTDAAVAPLAHALADPDVLVRQASADALRTLAAPAVAPQLVKALGDADWKVYYASKDALAHIGAAAVPNLVQALASPTARISYTAEQALAQIGQPAVPALIGSLNSDNPQVLNWVSIALGDIGFESIAPAAAQLRSNPKASARAAAATALGHTGQSDAVTSLLPAAGDTAPEVRIAVAAGLVKLGNPKATPVLVKLLQDPDEKVRAATMQRMFEWYDPLSIPQLAKLLTSQNGDSERRGAILLAHHVGGQEELRAAIASATSAGESRNVTRTTIREIGDALDRLRRGPNAGAQATLERLLKTTQGGTSTPYTVVVGLSSLLDATTNSTVRDWALGVLQGQLDSQNAEIQQTAAVAIARNRVPGILETTVADPKIPPDVQSRTIAALGLLGTGTSVKALIPLCATPGTAALEAADAIGKIGRRLSETSEGKDPQAAQAAKTLLELAGKQTDEELRARLAVAVATIGEAAVNPAIDYLKTVADDRKPFAAAIIGKLGNVAVDPYLLRARSQVRLEEGRKTLRDWLTVALYATGDKMARDFVSSLPDEEKPPQDEIGKTTQQLDILLNVK